MLGVFSGQVSSACGNKWVLSDQSLSKDQSISYWKWPSNACNACVCTSDYLTMLIFKRLDFEMFMQFEQKQSPIPAFSNSKVRK